MERKTFEIYPTLSVNPDSSNENVVKFPEKTGIQGIITDIRDIQTAYGSKPVLTIEAGEDKYNLFLNNASLNNLIKKWGNEDSNFIGKIVNLRLDTDKKYKKKMIVVEPVA